MKITNLLITTFIASTIAASASAAPPPQDGPSSPSPAPPGSVSTVITLGNPGTVSETCSKLKFRKGFLGEVGVGHRFNKHFRSALVFQHKLAKSKKCDDVIFAKLRMYGVTLNGYLDAANNTIFTPYAMAGAGIGHNSTRIHIAERSGTANRTNILLQAGVGCQAKITNKLNFDLSYRYEYLGKFGSKTVNGNGIKVKTAGANEFLAGLVWNFDSKDSAKHKNNFALFNLGPMLFS